MLIVYDVDVNVDDVYDVDVNVCVNVWLSIIMFISITSAKIKSIYLII